MTRPQRLTLVVALLALLGLLLCPPRLYRLDPARYSYGVREMAPRAFLFSTEFYEVDTPIPHQVHFFQSRPTEIDYVRWFLEAGCVGVLTALVLLGLPLLRKRAPSNPGS